MSFDTLGLAPESLRAVADQGYSVPTPVQAQAIPIVLGGRDLLAGAETGTGKTAAFVLPMLQGLHQRRNGGPRRVRGLVIVPTRELALQVEESVRTYGAHRPIRSVAIYGGVRMDRQVRALRNGAEIVVATPGRLLDHVRQRTIDLRFVEILVLDEADRMLDMGFIHDIKAILKLLPEDRQSLLFSATFNSHIRKLAEQFLREPESVDVAPRNAPAAPIRQLVHPVDKGRKRDLLSHLVRTEQIGQALVFTRTKRGASRLAEQLDKDGISAAAIHGNKSQSQRVRALTAFKKGHAQVLVATDVAARGLDIEALPHVVNFELPTVPEDYVHRIGRTGRAGTEGTAISLVSHDEHEQIRDIENLLKKPIDREVVEGFEPSMPLPSSQSRGNGGSSRPRHRGGKRRPPWEQRPGGAQPRNHEGRGRPQERRVEVEHRSRDGQPASPPQGSSPRRGGRSGHVTMPGEQIAGGHARAKSAKGRQHRSGGGGAKPRHRGGRPRS